MKSAYKHLDGVARQIVDSGLWKNERVIVTPQSAVIDTAERTGLINMCANNYLGLADDERVKAAAKAAVDRWGYGLSSVRFICGTQSLHKELEAAISAFLGTEDTILYSSCYDANGGLFETILGEEDAIISDELNHASIIDGIRLCKAQRFRYKNNDMAELELCLKETAGCRIRAVVTDGVFSMDGIIADLSAVCALAEKYDAMLIVDDSHGVGVNGATLRGTHEHRGVIGRIDVLTGTLGKALGGASGGYTSGSRAVIDLLRQRSRTYLFSNTLSPVIAGATLTALDLIRESDALARRLKENTAYFRSGLEALGFDIVPGEHPIVPVMTYEESASQLLAQKLLEKNVYAIGFFYPVVPKGRSRVRTQVSAAHTKEQLDLVLKAFKEIGPGKR